MSASREKKKRQEFLASGGVDPKAVREAEEKAAAKKANTLYAGLAIAFVVIAIALFVYNSGIIQRSQVAVTIDGQDYTSAQVSYYYGGTYQNLLKNYGDYISIIGLDTSRPLEDQPAWGSGDQSWDEYFKEQATDSLRFVQAVLAKAEAEGVKLEDADLEEYEATIAAMKEAAASQGLSYKSYLSSAYGSTMTPEVYEDTLKQDMLASKYVNDYYAGITVNDDEITAYYEENKNSYDTVDGAYLYLSGAASSKTDADGKTVAATDEEQAAAMAAAKETAEEILAAYKKGGDLEALAEEHGATYISNTKMTYSSDTTYSEWLFDESRSAGDLELIEDESTKRYYILQFNSRERREEASTYDVRHILINEESDGVDASASDVDAQVLAKAKEVLDEWNSTSRTEVDFALLAAQYTQDSNGEDGGLYMNVAPGDMVSEFEDWCYADGRQPGDVGIVKTSYGQHIMYFVGYSDIPYWYAACQSAAIEAIYNDWRIEMTDSVTAVEKSGMSVVGY